MCITCMRCVTIGKLTPFNYFCDRRPCFTCLSVRAVLLRNVQTREISSRCLWPSAFPGPSWYHGKQPKNTCSSSTRTVPRVKHRGSLCSHSHPEPGAGAAVHESRLCMPQQAVPTGWFSQSGISVILPWACGRPVVSLSVWVFASASASSIPLRDLFFYSCVFVSLFFDVTSLLQPCWVLKKTCRGSEETERLDLLCVLSFFFLRDHLSSVALCVFTPEQKTNEITWGYQSNR